MGKIKSFLAERKARQENEDKARQENEDALNARLEKHTGEVIIKVPLTKEERNNLTKEEWMKFWNSNRQSFFHLPDENNVLKPVIRLEDLTCDQLKTRLRTIKKPVGGCKADLIKRIREHEALTEALNKAD